MFLSVQTGTFVSHNKDFLFKPRGFHSIEEHNEAIIERHNSIVVPEDIVYCLGDCGFGTNLELVINYIKQLNGKKYLAIGNHDTDNKIKAYKEANLFEDIQFGYRIRFKKFEYLLTHYPTLVYNGDDPKPVWNIHGHDHDNIHFHSYGHNYDVSMEAHNCYPIALEEIHQEIKNKIKGEN